MADEVTFVLEAIKTNWPGSTWPEDAVRINRDDPKRLDTGERTREFDLTDGTAIGASLARRDVEAIGGEYDHNVEVVISVRIEGLHEDEWGAVPSASWWREFVRSVRRSLLAERAHPSIDGYHTLFVENESGDSAANRDYFRTDFDVRLRGYEELP